MRSILIAKSHRHDLCNKKIIMNFAQILRDIENTENECRDLAYDDAERLFAAMLDQAVPDLQLGALLLALRAKGLSAPELIGFHTALERRTHRLELPQPHTFPVVIPSYHGAREQPNLMPLVALLLARLNVPVVVHCTLESYGGVSSAAIFRELGILPCATLWEAQQCLERDCLALVPINALAPGLAALLSLRAQLGVRTCAHAMAKLVDPFAGESLRLVPTSRIADCDSMRHFFTLSGGRALVMRGSEGEAYADPHRRPKIELVCDSVTTPLFQAEHAPLDSLPGLPRASDARSTATWIRKVMAGQAPLPLPLANQLACCIYGANKADDFNQAKAIAAVQSSALAA